jgi:plasmid stabilization system protein ParE
LAFEAEFSVEAERDFALILDFQVDHYARFGEAPVDALDRATERIRGIQSDVRRLAKTPHRGTLHDDILAGFRHATIGKAIFRFDVDENANRVTALGVFFGGQEHRIAMLCGLLEE